MTYINITLISICLMSLSLMYFVWQYFNDEIECSRDIVINELNKAVIHWDNKLRIVEQKLKDHSQSKDICCKSLQESIKVDLDRQRTRIEKLEIKNRSNEGSISLVVHDKKPAKKIIQKAT